LVDIIGISDVGIEYHNYCNGTRGSGCYFGSNIESNKRKDKRTIVDFCVAILVVNCKYNVQIVLWLSDNIYSCYSIYNYFLFKVKQEIVIYNTTKQNKTNITIFITNSNILHTSQSIYHRK